jgi:hypothetical protein
LTLDDLRVAGNVALRAGGSITQTKDMAVKVGGNTTLTAGNGCEILLANVKDITPASHDLYFYNGTARELVKYPFDPLNDFQKTVNFVAADGGQLKNVAISDASAFNLEGLSLSLDSDDESAAVGQLYIIAKGDITQTAAFRVGHLGVISTEGYIRLPLENRIQWAAADIQRGAINVAGGTWPAVTSGQVEKDALNTRTLAMAKSGYAINEVVIGLITDLGIVDKPELLRQIGRALIPSIKAVEAPPLGGTAGDAPPIPGYVTRSGWLFSQEALAKRKGELCFVFFMLRL